MIPKPETQVLFGQRKNDTVMDIKSPTPAERTFLEKVGWKPGQKVPVDLARQIGDVDVTSELTPEVAQRIRAIMTHTEAEQQLAAAANEDVPEQPTPGALEALQQLQEGTAPRVDLPPAPAPEAAEMLSGAMPQLSNCPRCDWDLKLRDTVEVSTEDKQNFLAAVLGGTHFAKAYPLLGGNMEVTLRTLSMPEIDLCYRQCYFEQRRGELTTTAAIFEQMLRYQTLLKLQRVVSDSRVFTFPSSVDDWQVDAPGPDNTVLPAILREVTAGFLKSESIYRVISNIVMQFNRLVMKLEANVSNADFWKATGLQI
jgi:hypothetical protein